MLAHILEASGARVGMATTINIWTGIRKWVNETKMTTLSPFALQGLLRQMANHRCKYAIIETTSHALAQHRTWGIFYDIAVFTNITHDHLDFHKDFTHYREAKSKLFRELAESLRKPHMAKIAIVNISDPESVHFSSFEADKKYYFGIDNIETALAPDSLVWAGGIHLGIEHTHFTLNTPTGSIDIKLKLPGRFNVYNALAAATAAYSVGVDLPTIGQGLESMWQIPGRMESVPNPLGLTIIIDYAHTPDGFQQVFEALRPTAEKKLLAVFGAAGDRDKTKRPTLGAIASSFADYIVLTEEDPASEHPQDIVNQILPGIDKNKFRTGDNLHIILDRAEAITHALKAAQPGDTVVLLAIGAQTAMEKACGKVPYNERETVERIITAMS
ncbi:hypothetical protein A2V68_00710 [candidate division Kazan bacterium RBG_13_50_9]|uniref:UDP-N-acetylmuramoyl-L-alanyl-D-glutamate--2, 6-diaminopimelate ligase n=1 Tax=candidate division Kazan bacterium RBG_13_50_9 TaxID=1798535 RepID=A0A1F4NTR3_UNCK3|nr:MAG: hypothetical protein A2V68_00710 [candidate division Kazan bacterium RBG_13_50_9]